MAVKNIDEDFRNRYAEIPWKKIAGLRDVLIHEYFGGNMKRVWRVIKIDLPDLKSKISRIWEDIIIGLKRYTPCALPALRKATAGGRYAFR